MSDFRPPWMPPVDALTSIPVCVDPEVPAGTAVFVVDPEEPRHIQRINVRDATEPMPQVLTEEQVEQVRDHYQAMGERAGRLLARWRVLEQYAAAAVPEPPRPPFITGI